MHNTSNTQVGTFILENHEVATLSSARHFQRRVHHIGGSVVKLFKKSVVRVHHVGGNSATRYCDEVHHDGGRICLVKYLRKECPEDNQTTMVHLIREKFLCVYKKGQGKCSG